ncbi:MAG: RecJ [uncultured Solirubrobacteraceae bacterium]|uniref:inorganic diphosphatase n=1 Tax=uncultured Solirubrobacteraceae bacterium TaxID=1162706 RepID=A0A6J4TL80_9ACTN|nr:MAG: RecJ [uncultured Solirubrobacteraceae bacterium]
MNPVYVTGHRNPDLDSIGAAIGYAELRGRLDSATAYVPVRLGDVNAQTAWALERAEALTPDFLPHVHLRVCDVMRPFSVTARAEEPVRRVGLRMAEAEVDLVPVVEDGGVLSGVLTERELARQYIRESHGASTFADRPVRVSAIADVLGGELLAGEDRDVTGRLWIAAVEADAMDEIVNPGDILVAGDRPDIQRRALELGVAVLVCSHDAPATPEILEVAKRHGGCVVTSPLDSYVTGRLIGLAVPVRAIMSSQPPVVHPEELLTDIADRVVESRAVFAVGRDGFPLGLITRSDLVGPAPRRVLLVDHAEQAQSVPGVETAEIVEILDHHHVGSIETRVPVRATFDPVGSTATLVVERFRQSGREPRRSTAMMLLAALLSDTVVLSSPTTTDRDRAVVDYLEELLGNDARAFGMEMFESTSDVSNLDAAEIVTRDAKEYEAASGDTVSIAQVETVGVKLQAREPELLEALEAERERSGHAVAALMLTDIVSKGTDLLVTGTVAPVERAFGVEAADGVMALPGVMSRKKQVAPMVLAAL